MEMVDLAADGVVLAVAGDGGGPVVAGTVSQIVGDGISVGGLGAWIGVGAPVVCKRAGQFSRVDGRLFYVCRVEDVLCVGSLDGEA